MTKLAVIILDALDADNMRMLGMERIEERYEDNGEVLGISTIPHTAASNPMIWGGVENRDRFWVEGAEDWIDPAMHFDRDEAVSSDETELYTRDVFRDSFIWDDVAAGGYKSCAIQVPITLPPYSYNSEQELEDSWFPDTKERMKSHIRKKPALIEQHAMSGYDFIGTSFQMPDKWLHGVAEGKCDEEFMHSEAEVYDKNVNQLLTALENHGYDWLVFGDHGSPHPGAMPIREAQELLPRHRKESIIIGSEGLDLPTYTDEIYPWMLDYFGVEELGEVPEGILQVNEDGSMEEVEERLKNLGYK